MIRRLSFAALVALLAGCPRAPDPGTSSPGTSSPPSVVAVDRVSADAAPQVSAAPPLAAIPDRMELGEVDTYSFGIAADATHVYWADYHGGGGVFRARKDGGGRQKLGEAIAFARDVAVDDGFVYIAAASGPPGQIWRLPKTGGALETFAAAQWNPERVIAHHGRILWNANPPGVFLSAPSSSGATAAPVITGRVVRVTRHGDELVWSDEVGRISRSPIAGGAPTPVTALGTVPSDLAADERFVYVADAGVPVMPPSRPCPKNTPCPIATSSPAYPSGTVFAIPLAGGPRVPIARDLDWVTNIAVDDTYAYFASRKGVQRARKSGGGPIEAVDPSTSSSRLLVDGDRLIFQAGNQIVSLARRR